MRFCPLFRRLSEETGIPLVATNDCHYLFKEDAKTQSVLTCIQTGQVYGGNSLEFPTEEFYLKSEEEMKAAFPGFLDAVEQTGKIASRCRFDFTFGELKLPKFTAPNGKDNLTYFSLPL